MKTPILIAVAISLLISLFIPIRSTPQAPHLTKAISQTVPEKKAVVVADVTPVATTPIATTPTYTLDGGCDQYSALISQYDWNKSIAAAIMRAESGCRYITPDNSAINYDHVPDYGLFQLHGIDVTDPATNIADAYYMKYLTQGWHAWSTYNSGAYLKYLQ